MSPEHSAPARGASACLHCGAALSDVDAPAVVCVACRTDGSDPERWCPRCEFGPDTAVRACADALLMLAVLADGGALVCSADADGQMIVYHVTAPDAPHRPIGVVAAVVWDMLHRQSLVMMLPHDWNRGDRFDRRRLGITEKGRAALTAHLAAIAAAHAAEVTDAA